MHRSQFRPQNFLQMANTIKNWISLNFRESEKKMKKIPAMISKVFLQKRLCAHLKTPQNSLMSKPRGRLTMSALQLKEGVQGCICFISCKIIFLFLM